MKFAAMAVLLLPVGFFLVLVWTMLVRSRIKHKPPGTTKPSGAEAFSCFVGLLLTAAGLLFGWVGTFLFALERLP